MIAKLHRRVVIQSTELDDVGKQERDDFALECFGGGCFRPPARIDCVARFDAKSWKDMRLDTVVGAIIDHGLCSADRVALLAVPHGQKFDFHSRLLVDQMVAQSTCMADHESIAILAEQGVIRGRLGSQCRCRGGILLNGIEASRPSLALKLSGGKATGFEFTLVEGQH